MRGNNEKVINGMGVGGDCRPWWYDGMIDSNCVGFGVWGLPYSVALPGLMYYILEYHYAHGL